MDACKRFERGSLRNPSAQTFHIAEGDVNVTLEVKTKIG